MEQHKGAESSTVAKSRAASQSGAASDIDSHDLEEAVFSQVTHAKVADEVSYLVADCSQLEV
jgi:hypothetical protein